MRGTDARTTLGLTALFSVLALTLVPPSAFSAGDVDPSRLKAADLEPQNWFTLGRDQNQSYYSTLSKIDASNVSRLGFAWAYDLGTARGQEATPIVIDGIMYTSGTWGYVYALDAATGMNSGDPRADPRAARNPCCDLVNRGVAVWKGMVFVASVDGRLHAAKTGKELWNADTIIDHKLSYSSTGAVYIADHVAVIGNSGADMDKGGVRGYVSAYDVETGKLVWRFYAVPGAPRQPPEDQAMALAAKTWNRRRPLEFKGGGTVWDGFAYDPDADSGKVLNTIQTGSHIMAAPMTYAVDGVQYVAVQVRYGGTGTGVGSIPPTSAAFIYENPNRIIAFRLDGGDVPKPPVRKDEPFPKPPANEASPAEIQAGETKFIEQCSRCHTLGPNITPDLRKMPLEVHDMFKDILLGGAFARMGMESFGDILSAKDVENIHAYLIEQSWQAYRQQQPFEASKPPREEPSVNHADPH